MRRETSERVGLYAIDPDPDRCRRLESRLDEQRDSLTVTTDTDPSRLSPDRIVWTHDCLLVGANFDERTALALLRGVRDHDETFPVVLSRDGGVESRELEDRANAIVERTAGEADIQRLGRSIDLAVAKASTESTLTPPGLDALGDDLHYVVGSDGHLDAWNDRVPDVTGHAEEVLGRIDPLLLFVPEDRHAVRAAIGRCLGDGSTAVTARLRTAGGDARRFEFRAVRVTDASGTPTKICGVARDVQTDIPSAETIEARHRKLQAAASSDAQTSVLSD